LLQDDAFCRRMIHFSLHHCLLSAPSYLYLMNNRVERVFELRFDIILSE
jgi:hypothetical protein